MRHSTPSKILISEYLLLSYIVMLFAPISSFAADETGVIDNTGSIIESNISDTQTGDNIDATLVENTGSNLIETADSGATISTGSIDINIGTGGLTPMIESNGTGETRDITPESPIAPAQPETAVIEHVPAVKSESEILPLSESNPENEILIQFKGDIINTLGEYQIDQVETLHDLKTTDVITENNIAVMTPTAENIESIPNNDIQSYIKSENNERIDTLINELKKDPRVAHVQRNFIYTIQSVVNDPEYPKLWALNNEGQQVDNISGTPDADIDYPEAIAYASGRLNNKVIVAVLDTGITYNHPDLKDHMWNGTNCLSDTGAALGGCIHGYDFGDNDKDPADETSISPGHGTHIAGILGSTSNNGTGTVGIASNVEIMAVKVFSNTNQSTTSSIIRGINFAKYNGAKIINASFGGLQTIDSLNNFDMMTHDAIRDFPGLFIAAAGNDGSNTDSVQKFFPAGFGSDITVSGELVSGEIYIPGLQNVIAIAATDSSDQLASFSNYGSNSVHIGAPGKNIYTTHHIVSSELYDISKENGWIVSGENTINKWNKDGGSVYPDIQSVSGEQYVSGEMSYFQKTIVKNQFSKGWMENMAILCNTPGTIENPTDYLTIDYKTNGNYIQLYKLNEANISLYGEASEMGPGMFAWINTPIIPLDNSDLTFRFGWHTDGIDDINPVTGKAYLGCTIISGTTSLRYSDNGEAGKYEYKEGTSIATAHVAGAAALAWSYKPDATIEDIRNAILWGGDQIPALAGKTVTGKRLNLKGMLSALDKPIVKSHTLTLSGESGARFSVETTNTDIAPQVWISNNSELSFHNQNTIYAEALAENAIIGKQSTENGYRLNDTITRGELALIITKVGGYLPTNCVGNVFTDVKSTLGDMCGAIEVLADAGVISTANVQFRPTAQITRAEAIKMFLQAMGEMGSSTDAGYTDLAGLGDLVLFINKANELGCIVDNTYFYPNMSISRGDSYKVASCMMGLEVNTTNTGGIIHNNTFSLITDSNIDSIFKYSTNLLKSDTTYYYKIQVCTVVYCNDDIAFVRSFRTPKVTTTNISTPINIVSGEIYFSGSTNTGVSLSGSTGSGHIYLSNNINSIKADIPTQGLRIISSGSWDGIMHSPKQDLSGNIITTVEGKQIQPETVFSIGSNTTSLIFSGQVVQISVTVNGSNGSTREIYRSPNILTPYTKIGSCTLQSNTCTFTTDHFSLFALSNPTTNTTYTNTTGPGGGGGGNSINGMPLTTSIILPSTTLYSKDQQRSKIKTSTTLSTLKVNIRTLQKKILTISNSNPEKRTLILQIQNLYKEQIVELRKASQK